MRTSGLGWIGQPFLIFDTNARSIKAASLFKWADKKGVEGEQKTDQKRHIVILL